MEIAAYLILAVTAVTGFLAVFFTTFGTLIIFLGAAAFAWLTGFQIVGLIALAVIFGLYFLGEIVEYAFTVWGVKKAGASNWAALGAVMGGIAGAVSGMAVFGIGIIPGTFIGIFAGAFLLELMVKKDWRVSLKAGWGSMIGMAGAIFFKLLVACAIIGFLIDQIIRSLSKT